MTSVSVPGISGSSLLGFLSALGLLEVATQMIVRTGAGGLPSLSWSYRGGWIPTIAGVASLEELADHVLRDSRSAVVESVLSFGYVKVEKNGPKKVNALKPPVPVLRAALTAAVNGAQYEAADFLASLTCETAVESGDTSKVPTAQDLADVGVPIDNSAPLTHNSLPTPFDFTSRNAQFLEQVAFIRDRLTAENVLLELKTGQGASVGRIMRWDELADLPAAQFEGNAAVSRPAAEWLAFRGIRPFGLSVTGDRVRMPGFAGRRKSGAFSWVLWGGHLNRDVVRSVLGVNWRASAMSHAQAHGVLAGFEVEFRKDATGYDGVVSTAVPLQWQPHSDRESH